MPDPGRVEIRNSSLLTLIAMAYGVPKATIRAPKWARETLFNVDARPPAGTPREQVRGMLRSLLEERFGLSAHHESEEKSGYALLVSKGGPKLTPSASPRITAPTETDGVHDAELAAALMKRSKSLLSEAHQLPPGISHQGFANVDAQQVAGIISHFVEAPVLDMTGLKGTYDVTIDVGKQDQPEYSIFAAVEKLGLKLSRRRVWTDTLVVDRLEKEPTPN